MLASGSQDSIGVLKTERESECVSSEEHSHSVFLAPLLISFSSLRFSHSLLNLDFNYPGDRGLPTYRLFQLFQKQYLPYHALI
jgi:hypothetical protein